MRARMMCISEQVQIKARRAEMEAARLTEQNDETSEAAMLKKVQYHYSRAHTISSYQCPINDPA